MIRRHPPVRAAMGRDAASGAAPAATGLTGPTGPGQADKGPTGKALSGKALSVKGLSLKGRALKLLASRELTRAELAQRLAPHEQEPGQIASLLDELAARGHLSDQRAADALVHRRAQRFGAARVGHELRQRGTPEEIARAAVAELAATELERAREVWRRKFSRAPADAAERGRQTRFLASRGFTAETIHRVIGSAAHDEPA